MSHVLLETASSCHGFRACYLIVSPDQMSLISGAKKGLESETPSSLLVMTVGSCLC